MKKKGGGGYCFEMCRDVEQHKRRRAGILQRRTQVFHKHVEVAVEVGS